MTGSFLGINKWEPDIYIGFSSILHLQFRSPKNSDLVAASGKNFLN
jgi:hypothetical protein